MKISNQELIQYMHGALIAEELDGYVLLRRFPEAQAQKYITALNNEEFYKKTFASAGMRLAMKTDAKAISFQYRSVAASSQTRCVFDLYVEGVLVESAGSLEAEPIYEGAFRFALPEGEKQVEVYLPCLYSMRFSAVELEGATVAEPIAKAHKLLCYGDSITQGYTTDLPSLTYVNRLADLLDAEVVDKAIGGDRFNPYILEVEDGYQPDIVTVAYGTNDWRGNTVEVFARNHAAFIETVAKRYADAKVFVLTPIWRGNANELTQCGSFYEVCDAIRATAEQYENVTVIDGLSLVGHHPAFFMPDVLHPNDLGHVLYGETLAKEIKKHLQF